MRKLFALLAILLLTGCQQKAEVVYETVCDVLPTCALADAPYQIEVKLPEEVCEVSSNASGTIYEAPDGSYNIYTRVMVADSLDAAVYALSGFAQPQLRVNLAQDEGESCQFAWCSAGERGQMVCRAKVMRVGDYCYALCFSLREGLGSEYNACINEVFSSFALVQDVSQCVDILQAHSQ